MKSDCGLDILSQAAFLVQLIWRLMGGTSNEHTFGLYAADIVPSKTSSHGITNYTTDLIRDMADCLEGDRLVVIGNPIVEELLQGLNDSVQMRLLRTPRSGASRIYSDNFKAERIAASQALDVLHYPRGFVSALRFGRHLRIATVHDDIPIQYAHGRWRRTRLAKWKYLEWSIRRSLSNSDRIITVSEFSRTQLLGWCDKWGITAPEIDVVYPGVRKPYIESTVKERYILLFGSSLPHKRTALGIQLAAEYLRKRRLDLKIHIIGDVPDISTALASRVVGLGVGIPREQVHRYLAGALALVFPSEYEGFGLPPVESYVLGTPCVFAQTGVSREVMGGIPTDFDPEIQESFDDAMDTALAMNSDESAVFGTLLHGRYSTLATAQHTLSTYRELTRLES